MIATSYAPRKYENIFELKLSYFKHDTPPNFEFAGSAEAKILISCGVVLYFE